MLAIIFLALGLFFIVNPVLHLAGGYVMLFRTALNDTLSAQSKFKWMWAQTIFAPVILVYALLIEKNRALALTVCAFFLVALLGLSYQATRINWGGLYTTVNKTEALIENLEKMKGVKPGAAGKAEQADKKNTKPDAARLNDELSTKADRISTAMLQMYNKAPGMESKSALNNTDIALAHLRREYIYFMLPAEQFETLLNDLTSKISGGVLATEAASQWIVQANDAVNANQKKSTASKIEESYAEADKAEESLPDSIKKDPVFSSAQSTAQRVAALEKAETDPGQKGTYKLTGIVVSALKAKAASNLIQPKPNSAVQNQKINELLNNLNNRLNQGTLTQKSMLEWINLCKAVLAKKE